MRLSFEGTDTELVNLREVESGVWDTYIGRASPSRGLRESPHKNPFRESVFGREDAVALFRVWFYHRVRTNEAYQYQVDGLDGRVLACWCVPKECHGEVICRYLSENVSADESVMVETAERYKDCSFTDLTDSERSEIESAISWALALDES